VGQKLGVSIGYNGLRHSMEPNDLLEIQLRNVASIISFVAWNKVCHLGKSIYNHHDCIISPLGSRCNDNEIHTNIIPRL